MIFNKKTGRYDSPQHPLYVPEDSQEYKNDWYNSEILYLEHENPKIWPRLAWHDVHSRIEGPIVKDIVNAFEDKWKAKFPGELLFDFNSPNAPTFDWQVKYRKDSTTFFQKKKEFIWSS